MRVFGYLIVFAFPTLDLTINTSLILDPPLVSFLGYATQHKGYICLTPSGKIIIISRHVLFDETKFLFQDSQSPFPILQPQTLSPFHP